MLHKRDATTATCRDCTHTASVFRRLSLVCVIEQMCFSFYQYYVWCVITSFWFLNLFFLLLTRETAIQNTNLLPSIRGEHMTYNYSHRSRPPVTMICLVSLRTFKATVGGGNKIHESTNKLNYNKLCSFLPVYLHRADWKPFFKFLIFSGWKKFGPLLSFQHPMICSGSEVSDICNRGQHCRGLNEWMRQVCLPVPDMSHLVRI